MAIDVMIKVTCEKPIRQQQYTGWGCFIKSFCASKEKGEMMRLMVSYKRLFGRMDVNNEKGFTASKQKKPQRKKISLNPITSTICSGLTWRTAGIREIAPSLARRDAPQSFPVSAQTLQSIRHSPGHQCHRSLFATLFGSGPVSLGRRCPSCEW